MTGQGFRTARSFQSGVLRDRVLATKALVRGPRRAALVVGLCVSMSVGAQAPPPAAAPNAAAGTSGASEARVEALLGQMTLEEKVDLLGGVDTFYLRGVPRLGVPRFRMADGPFGVRSVVPATAMAAGIALAAAWNPALAESVGRELGRDARARGVHFLLAPGVNIYRTPLNGRNFEYFGEDPLLAARTAVAYIKGVQRTGVSATVKHFLGNNSEYDRNNVDSVIDEQALREIYLPAFEAAVKDAHVGAVMTSYNRVYGIHMSENTRLDLQLLKQEWGFDGVVMSDWDSVYDGVAAAESGLDLEMPSAAFMNRETLLPAIQSGTVSAASLDDKVRRLLRLAVRFGWLDREQSDLSVPAVNPQGRAVALQAAREGMVLLKNQDALLPLDRKTLHSVAVIGPLAHPAVPVGGGSAAVRPFHAVSSLEGLIEALGPGVTVYHHRGILTPAELADRTSFTTDAAGQTVGVKLELFANLDLSGAPVATRTEAHVDLTEPFVPVPPPPPGKPLVVDSSARWTGYFTPTQAGAHRVVLQDFRGEGGCRVLVDDRPVIDNWDIEKAMLSEATLALDAVPHRIVLECFRRRIPGSTGVSVRLGIAPEDSLVDPAARALAARADVVVAAVGFDSQWESESGDRTFTLPLGQDRLINELVAANKKTIVSITSGGGVDMTPWIEAVPAVVETWFAGQEGGAALAELLLGEANFSGRLPVSFERRLQDNPSYESYYPAPGSRSVRYTNGVFVGYRGFEHKKTAPLFPFGFGLSYTEFSYANLAVSPRDATPGPVYAVAFDVRNVGTREGADVPQVYVAELAAKRPRPPKELKGFAKLRLAPGETRRVSLDLDARAFSHWDVATHQWRIDPGRFEILVGASSAQISLRQSVTLK